MSSRYYETRKRYREKHLELYRKSQREWKKRNKEAVNAMRRKHYAVHKDEEKLKAKLYAKANPKVYMIAASKRRTKITKAGGSFTVEQWKLLCKKYNNKCVCCGKRRKLTPDHVIPVSRGGSSNISNIQPLCKPCNCSKHTGITDYRKVKNICQVLQ